MAKRKRKTKQVIAGTCAYCGQNDAALTEDHVIPQCLFGNSVPADIPIVYACGTCNGDVKSKDDVWLRDALMIDIDAFGHPVASQIFSGKFMSAVRKGKASPVVWAAQNQVTPVPVFTPGGLFAGMLPSVTLPLGRMNQTMSRIVRGLYLAYTNEFLPDDAKFALERPRDLSKIETEVRMLRMSGALHVEVGDGTVFRCLYAVVPDNPRVSLWLLCFYERVVFAVLTN